MRNWANIMWFCFGVLASSILGAYLMALGFNWGGLIFVLGPAVMGLGLRAFRGDGWHDVGLAFNIANNIRVYLLLVLLFPVAYAVALGAAAVLGYAVFQPDFWRLFVMGIAGAALPSLVFSFSEELGWRGYLEPRLASLGVSARWRHSLVGLVWAIWHVPYLIQTQQTYGLPPVLLVISFGIGTIILSFVFGRALTISRSLWPIVICHALANILAAPLLSPKAVTIEYAIHFGPRPDTTIGMLIMLLAWYALGKTSNK